MLNIEIEKQNMLYNIYNIWVSLIYLYCLNIEIHVWTVKL